MKKGGLYNLSTPKGNSAAHDDKKDRREGDDAQPPDLKKKYGNHLAGEGKVFPDIDAC